MPTLRISLLMLSLVVVGLTLVPRVSHASAGYFTSTDTGKNCASSRCHFISTSVAVPPTCNGCHGHGTHGSSTTKGSMNLAATTNKTSYAPGDDISVTLSGGYRPSSWVRVNVYASNGTLLVSNKTDCPHNSSSYAASCDLPVTLKTRAVSGMTNLYVGWVGNEYDPDGAAGAPIASGIGVGMRAAPLPAPTGHVEEVVLTTTFSVTETAAPASGGGGGSLDWALLSGLIGLAFLRCKIYA